MDPSRDLLTKQNNSFSGIVSYRPVVAATFFVDYAFWKENPLGHHFTNIALHFVVTVLVFYFMLYLTAIRGIAFLTASFFAVHPIQSEVVNFIGYRSDILMTLFYLTGILAYLRYNAVEKKGKWLIVACLSYFCALFSKETALTFPFVVLIIDRFFLNQKNTRKTIDIIRNKVWIYVMLGLITLFYMYVYFVLMPNAFYPQFTPRAQIGIAKFVLMLKIFTAYVSVLILPFKVTVLPPLYAPPIFPLYPMELFVPVCVTLLSAALGFYFYRRNKLITFGLVWFYIQYVLVSGFVPLLNPLAFRFLYLPSIGFFLLVAIAVKAIAAWLNRKNDASNISALFQATLIGLLMALTIANNAFFKNNFVACQEMLRRYPDSSRPSWILGHDYYRAGNYEEAAKYLRMHLKVAINNPFISGDKEKFMTYHLLGRLVEDPDVAIGYLEKARDLSPGLAIIYLDLSKNYITKKDYPTALAYARQALKFDSGLSSAYVYMIHIYIESGDLVQARAILTQAVQMFGNNINLRAVEKYLNQKEQAK